ncbi:hypothetical protein EPO44_07715 [bacterium]|nr:MAG: hypothetical protein EPO44_07715 [bacterium]
MNRFENSLDIQPEWVEELRPWVRPILIASATVAIFLMIIVGFSKSAWMLLGAGRGFIPEGYYHVWGFVLMFGTTFGQAVGWAGGSAVAFYVMTLVGFPAIWTTARLAMSIVYLGLAALPLSVYHILYGGWLLGMPRVGLKEWLAANYPGAYWLLITAHPVVDLSLIPLGIVFLWLLWKFGDRVQREPAFQTALVLSLLATSLAVALSLGIHSTLVHIRIGF